MGLIPTIIIINFICYVFVNFLLFWGYLYFIFNFIICEILFGIYSAQLRFQFEFLFQFQLEFQLELELDLELKLELQVDRIRAAACATT